MYEKGILRTRCKGALRKARLIHSWQSWAVMMKFVPRSLPGRGLLAIVTIWMALSVTSSQIGEIGNLSGPRLAEPTTVPVKILSGPQGGDQRSVVKDKAQANSPVSERQKSAAAIATDSEVRRLRLFHVHTRELLAVTYKRDGRYIPSAMAQLDYFLRDWRSNSFVSISGETIDLLWELHNELGSNQPIHIISGFRSAQTNALLKRIGRNVSNRSEHILGRAIDVQFPDVPLKVLRNRALVRQAGGVGYYPAGNGGFVHINSGRMRHWPGISRTELAEIFAEHNGHRRIGDQQVALGSRTAVAQQNRDRTGPIGWPAIDDLWQSARAVIDSSFVISSLASANALLVRSLTAPDPVLLKQRSNRSLRRQDRPNSRSAAEGRVVRSLTAPDPVVLKQRSNRSLRRQNRPNSRSAVEGRVGAACCGPDLRKQTAKASKKCSVSKHQRQSSKRPSVAKRGSLPVAYKQVLDLAKRTLSTASAIARKAKGLVNATALCPVSELRGTASKNSSRDSRCQVARIKFVDATQLGQIAKLRSKRLVPATQTRNRVGTIAKDRQAPQRSGRS